MRVFTQPGSRHGGDHAERLRFDGKRSATPCSAQPWSSGTAPSRPTLADAAHPLVRAIILPLLRRPGEHRPGEQVGRDRVGHEHSPSARPSPPLSACSGIASAGVGDKRSRPMRPGSVRARRPNRGLACQVVRCGRRALQFRAGLPGGRDDLPPSAAYWRANSRPMPTIVPVMRTRRHAALTRQRPELP